MNDVQKIAAGINQLVPDGKAEAFLHMGHFRWCIRWVYNCPCGELSEWRQFYDDEDRIPVDAAIKQALRAMRRHVRSEGNEPNF